MNPTSPAATRGSKFHDAASPPMAERITPMVMKGPMPIISSMFTAVDCSKPMPRTSFSEATEISGGRCGAEFSAKSDALDNR